MKVHVCCFAAAAAAAADVDCVDVDNASSQSTGESDEPFDGSANECVAAVTSSAPPASMLQQLVRDPQIQIGGVQILNESLPSAKENVITLSAPTVDMVVEVGGNSNTTDPPVPNTVSYDGSTASLAPSTGS